MLANACDVLYATDAGLVQPDIATWAPHSGARVAASAAINSAATPRTAQPLPRRERGVSSTAVRPHGSGSATRVRSARAEAVVTSCAAAAAAAAPTHVGCSLRLTPQRKGAKLRRAARLQLQLPSPSRAQVAQPRSAQPPALLCAGRCCAVAGIPFRIPTALAACHWCVVRLRLGFAAPAARLAFAGLACVRAAPVEARSRGRWVGFAPRAPAAPRRARVPPRPATRRRSAELGPTAVRLRRDGGAPGWGRHAVVRSTHTCLPRKSASVFTNARHS